MKLDKLKYLAAVTENVSDIVTILEVTGNVRYESAAIKPILGYEQQDLIGKNVFDYIHPEDRSRVVTLFKQGLQKPGHIEKPTLRFKHKNGEWRILECSAKNLLFDPSVVGIVVTSRDVTEEKQLERHTRLITSALEAAANGVVISERSGTIIWVNPAFSRMTGYSSDEAVGRTPRILRSGEQPPETYKELWETVLAGRIWRGELINRRKDGSLYFEFMTITPLVNELGEITHFVAIKEDISGRKKMEAEFRQVQKMEAVGRLAGGIAHDFNNLLTVIIGHSMLMLQNMTDEDDIRPELEEIKQTALRAAELTKQLLAFSRKQVFQPKVLDLNTMVRQGDKLMRRLVGDEFEVVCLLGESLKPIKADPSQIDQMIMNLVVNARDAMEKGGKITLETKNVFVTEGEAARYTGLVPGPYVLLTVSDTGCGMSEEIQAHIFEPFFTTKEVGKGSGMGLSMVYGVVKQSNGYIYVDSKPGKGTTFRIYLRPTTEEAAHASKPVPAAVAGGTETILLAEDEELVRNLAAHTLARNGYKVMEARNGTEALHMIQESTAKIDLLMTDVVMPHMGGTELAEKVSALYPGLPVVFTSGYVTQNSSIQRWLEKGCLFLQKPYEPGQLLLLVRQALDAH